MIFSDVEKMTILQSSILILISSFVSFQLYSRYISITIELPDEEYDFIIVGGGTTGNVVASRLSEETSFKVLILEAGSEDGFDPRLNIPIFSPFNTRSQNDWGYESESQPGIFYLKNNNVELLTRGKTLGGSSAANFQYYMRGSPSDYDSWESEGNVGWGFESVLKYFIKSERSDHVFPVDKEFHGKDGPLHIKHHEKIPLTDVFLNATKEIGLKHISDHNGKDIIGAALMQTSVKNGIRQSSSTAYLRHFAKQRKDRLHIVADAHVTQILIKERKDGIKSATGVEFIKNGKTISVNAKKEVILSAGVYGTPHILMLSGIGPAYHLQEHGINVIKDLHGVGSNYQDHIARPLYFYARNLSFGDTSGNEEIFSSIPGWIWKGTGPLGNIGGALANFKVKDSKSDVDDTPDIQAIFIPIKSEPFFFDLMISNWNYKQDVFKHEYERAKQERNSVLFSYMVEAILLHPKSRGNVRLKSSNPLDKPRIDPKVFSHPDDLITLAEGVKWIMNLTSTKAFANVEAEFVPMHTECDDKIHGSDEYYKCISTGEASLFHGCCTAKMGSFDDSDAVVDSQLRVFGVKHLRIADSSIMPHQISAGPQATCFMIGEKAAELIKETHLK
ncbi:L-sorbose 1-dehydrogenase-like isoform X2 [Styela clava]